MCLTSTKIALCGCFFPLHPPFDFGLFFFFPICPEAFLALHPDAHPIFQPMQIPCSGLSLFRPDWMHTKLLGVDSNLLGGAILFLAKEIMPGTLDENIALIWLDIKEHYKKNKTSCRISRLTAKMVQHVPFPKLSAKALEVRGLVPVVRDILKNWVVVDKPEVAWYAKLLDLSCQMDEVVFGCKELVLPPAARLTLRDAIFGFNQVLTVLARSFLVRGMAYANFTVKNHFLCHLGVDAAKSGISPRLGFCFQGEDYVQVLKNLCQSSQRGVAPAKLANKVLEKYLRGLDLLLPHA